MQSFRRNTLAVLADDEGDGSIGEGLDLSVVDIKVVAARAYWVVVDAVRLDDVGVGLEKSKAASTWLALKNLYNTMFSTTYSSDS